MDQLMTREGRAAYRKTYTYAWRKFDKALSNLGRVLVAQLKHDLRWPR